MLIFLDAQLAYLATPKTGTSAIEGALRRRADIVFQRGRKHMPSRRYANKVAPFVEDAFNVPLETVAMMREPEEQLRSWYRYRTRDELIGQPRSTRGASFDDFVRDVISDDPPVYARINGQFNFLCKNGMLMIDHLFCYTEMEKFRVFMSERLGFEVVLETRNVSPGVDAPLPAETRARLLEAWASEYALYQRLVEAGGYLNTPQVTF